MRTYDQASRVEEFVLGRSDRPLRYTPTEKLGIVEVPDFPSLGKLTALRFLEWLQKNPDGVISLPTGKTPEHFIRWTVHYLAYWDRSDIQKELEEWGLRADFRPDMQLPVFVQIDEFYPMNPRHENSFASYIDRFYFGEFGLDRSKALLMDTWQVGAPEGKALDAVFPDTVDLTLRYRQTSSERERLQQQAVVAADQWAMEYEQQIQALGGIGFFLGGIGPDGHIGFNIRGSDHLCTTRLSPINYETAATAASDLGGIEIARNKVVLTIGLRTITHNETATALVIAAGESKSRVVRDAVEREPSVLYPATALQALSGARVYLTRGAASLLCERRCHELKAMDAVPAAARERILVDIASAQKKRLIDLAPADLAGDRLGSLLLESCPDLRSVTGSITRDLKEKISQGLETEEGLTFLHTGPHHDDIMLGYMPYIVHLVRSPQNQHYFATLTSGFTSVTNDYTLAQVQNLQSCLASGALEQLVAAGYFAPGDMVSRSRDVYQYLDGVAASSAEMQHEAEARRLYRNIAELIGESGAEAVGMECRRLTDYFAHTYPGKKDTRFVQKLKGMIREFEEELIWGHLGFNCDHVFHLRLGFYTGDVFTPQPEMNRDVEPVLELLETVHPDVLTVTFDPEASGPDTHYKVLQATAEALKLHVRNHPKRRIRVLGYRNVWFRFHPAEADIAVPVSMNSLAILKSSFLSCFGSQRNASFPSPEHDGPFCDLAQRIMVEQYTVMKTCLGRDFFYTNPHPRLRASRGLVFLRSMEPEEFFEEARSLKKLTES